MSKAIAAILIIFAVICVVGAVNVYGDTYTELIEIPIPGNVTGIESKKQLTSLTDDLIEYTITLRFHLGQNGTQWFDDELTEKGITPPDVTLCPDRFYLDDDGITCYPIITQPPAIYYGEIPEEFEPFVNDLLRFDEDPPTKPSEIDYYEQLKFLQMCYRVTEQNQQSLGVTQTDGFAVSNLWIEEYGILLKASQMTGNLAELNKHIEECFAIHTQLNPLIFGAEYQNRAKYFNSTQPYHGDLASDVPVWTQERVNQESNDLNEPSTISPICVKDSYYSDVTKRMYCGDDYIPRTAAPLEEERIDEMCNSMFVMPDFKRSHGCTPEQIAIPCYACEKHTNIYTSEAQRLYADYVNNGDTAQYEMLKQKAFAEKLAQLLGE